MSCGLGDAAAGDLAQLQTDLARLFSAALCFIMVTSTLPACDLNMHVLLPAPACSVCRFCAGYAVAMAEMKVFLAFLARDYVFTADTNTEWKQMIGRVPVNGLPMRVSRRRA
jgi:hypothetical protein